MQRPRRHFPLILTTDPEAPANSVEVIGVDVYEMSSSVYIAPLMSRYAPERRSTPRSPPAAKP